MPEFTQEEELKLERALNTILIDKLVTRADNYRKALQGVVNHLGPDKVTCEGNDCLGCRAEMAEALRIAKEALGPIDAEPNRFEQHLGQLATYLHNHPQGVRRVILTRDFRLNARDADTLLATLEGRGLIHKVKQGNEWVLYPAYE
jgi:hypothetical protein